MKTYLVDQRAIELCRYAIFSIETGGKNSKVKFKKYFDMVVLSQNDTEKLELMKLFISFRILRERKATQAEHRKKKWTRKHFNKILKKRIEKLDKHLGNINKDNVDETLSEVLC